MNSPVRTTLLASVIAVGCLAPKAFADKDSNPQPQALERGPIHEAFAMPWLANPSANSPISQAPPEPIKEEPPDQAPTGKNVKWIPGYWQWDLEKKDFVWVGGFWRNLPEGRRWVPGYWAETSAGNRWVSGHWAADQEPDNQYVPTPPENPDAGPSTPAPDGESFYIPGSWFYGDNGYSYRDGYWAGYRPGYLWYPAKYIWTPFGWIFASGYWDYYWPSRGLLYPDLYFGFQFPYLGYIYHPYYCLRANPLANGLFVNPLASHYYYGHYASGNFRQWGLQPWANYSARAYDPIFAYERIANRGNPQWQSGLQAQSLSGANSPSLLTSTQQLQSSGLQFSQLTSQQRQSQLQGAQQLISQSQQFRQQSSRNLTQIPTNLSGSWSNVGGGNFSNRISTSNYQPGGQVWPNRPSFSSSNFGSSRPSFGSQSFSRPSFSSPGFSGGHTSSGSSPSSSITSSGHHR